MQDRLRELTGDTTEVAPGNKGDDSTERDDESQKDEVEMGEHTAEADEFMKEFFEEVNSIKQGLAQIKKNVRQIEDTYGQALVAVGLEQGNKSSEELERLIDDTNLAATDVRNRLKEMDAANKKSASKEKGTAQYRIKTNMHGTLARKFMDQMAEYQEVQTKFKNKFRERVERQYRIVKPEATQEEIQEALESGNTQIFAKEILNQRHSQAKDALNYIENRHKDILRLEQSIKELQQLFFDMAILVEAQGELIDQIEYNVSQAGAYTKEAVKNLRDANKYQKRSRKKMCCIIGILLAVIIIIVGGGAIIGTTVK